MQKGAKDSSVNRVGNRNGNSCLDSPDHSVGLFARDRDSIFNRLRCRKMATGHGGTLKSFARSLKPGIFALVRSIHHITLRLRMFHGSLSIRPSEQLNVQETELTGIISTPNCEILIDFG